jgi:hypothetical protein
MNKPPPDKCYVSISNTPQGYLLRDHRKPEGETDRLLTAGEMLGHPIYLGEIVCPDGWQDALKLSNISNVHVCADFIMGGTEDVIDINKCHDVTVSLGDTLPMGRYLATVKGGSSGVIISVNDMCGHGSETDFDFGNWSDQSQEKTVNSVVLVVTAFKEVFVRAINSDKPQVDAGKGTKVRHNGWLRGWFPYVQLCLKKLGWA